MKKALVMTFVLVLGLGLAVSAGETLTGKFNGSVSLFPAASAFSDFVKSFKSEVDFNYSVGGWVFGVESTMSVAGLTGMDFNADGVLGAFTFDFDLDFIPMLLVTTATTYTDTSYQTVSCGAFSGLGFVWGKKTVTNTYTAAFDDLTAQCSVSIAGVNFAGLFFLEGSAHYASYTGSSFYLGATPAAWVKECCCEQDVDPEQTASTVARAAAYGAGWKFSASGSFGGATLEALAYFNLSEPWYNTIMAAYGPVYVADTFKKYGGYYSIACPDCVSRFTTLDIILTDVSFACTSFSAGVEITCCGFQWAKFLIEDIGLGCCWDINFDLLITFSTLDKAITVEPDITIANACFTLDIVLLSTVAEDNFTLTGIDIRALGLSYSWNGITFTSETSWDMGNHPILGDYGGGYISGPDKIYIWKPDTTFSTVTLGTDCEVTGATYAIDSAGLGYWTLASYACERAYAYEKFGITVDGDACCGGDFAIKAFVYFGDVKELTTLVGTYSADTDYDGAYDDVVVNFYGAGTGVTPDPWTYGSLTWCDACCALCPVPTLEVVDIDPTYTHVKTANRLFNWIETDVDVTFAIASNFDLKFGLDVNWYGWEDFTIGFEFVF